MQVERCQLKKSDFRISEENGQPTHQYFLYSKQREDEDIAGLMRDIETNEEKLRKQLENPKLCINTSRSGMGKKSCEVLARSKHLGHLDCLSINVFLFRANETLAPDALQQLAKGQWNQLNYIYLAEAGLTSKGLQHLAKGQWPHLKNFESNNNQIRWQGCMYLLEAKWSKLQILVLKGGKIQDRGCKYLARLDLPQLKKLYLIHNQVGQKGCKYLSKGRFNQLECLSLTVNCAGEKGCKAIIRGNWYSLAQFAIGGNKIGARGCKEIVSSQWPCFGLLNLQYTGIGRELTAAQIRRNTRCARTIYVNNYSELQEQGCKYLQRKSWLIKYDKKPSTALR